jgi:hypothetical protein
MTPVVNSGTSRVMDRFQLLAVAAWRRSGTSTTLGVQQTYLDTGPNIGCCRSQTYESHDGGSGSVICRIKCGEDNHGAQAEDDAERDDRKPDPAKP